jgi:hypothetical protein
MNFEWAEYLNLAKELAGQTVSRAGQQARFGAAMSRAYDAAFCKCRNHLRDKEGLHVPSGSKAHLWINFRTAHSC